MKSQQQLYHYCKETNNRTKNWIRAIENGRIADMETWQNSAASYGDGAYQVAKIERGYLGPADELWGILKQDCNEEVYIDDVRVVTDRIFRDMSSRLTALLGKPSHHVVMRVNSNGEGLFFIGPRSLPFDILFSDEGVFMTVGYDVLKGFLDRADTCSFPELYRYLSSNGFQIG